MVYSKNDFKFCVGPPGGLLLWDTKKTRNLGPKSHKCPFLTYLYFLEYFCLQVAIFKKVPPFATLEEMVFGKPSGCASKICDRLFWGLKGKKEIKGLFVKFWWEVYLKLWFFVPKFSNKAIFGTDRAQKSIKMAWIPEEWVCICKQLWIFLIKLHFWAWTRPFFEIKVKIWILALSFLKSAYSRTLTRVLMTSKRPKTALFGIFA